MLWDKESALEHRPLVRTIVNGKQIQGSLHPNGNNVYVVAAGTNGRLHELSVSWGLVLSVLNDVRQSPIDLT